MMTRRQGWARTLGWTTVFSVILVIVTDRFITKTFAYLGYVPREFSGWDLLISGLAAFGLATTLPHRWHYPSHSAYAFLIATIGLPIIFIPLFWGPLTTERLTLMQTATLTSFCLARLSITGGRRRIKLPKVNARVYWAVVILFALVTLIYLFVTTGISPRFLSLSDVYEQRSEYIDNVTSLGSYAVGWLSGGVMPAVLAAGLYYRSRLLIAGGVIGVALLYSLTGNKSFLVGIALTIAAYYLSRRRRRVGSSWLSTLTAVVLGSVVLSQLTDTITFTSLLVRRALSTAGLNTALYFEYFDQADKYELKHSVLSMLGPSPYDVAPARLIGSIFYPSRDTAANANLIADGFANFGFIGCLVAGVALGLCLRFYDKVSIGLPLEISGPAMLPVLIALANTAPLTVLATHGGLVLALFIALMPRGQNEMTDLAEGASALTDSEPLSTSRFASAAPAKYSHVSLSSVRSLDGNNGQTGQG